MIQYPDTIVVSWGSEPVQDTITGSFSHPIPESHTFECRAEINSEPKKIPGADGSMIDYGYNIFMPKTEIIIPIGADTILNGNQISKVKGAKNGQFNSRLWV